MSTHCKLRERKLIVDPASWDCVSVIVKTGADLRQEQLAVQLIREFEEIWRDEDCPCFVRPLVICLYRDLNL